MIESALGSLAAAAAAEGPSVEKLVEPGPGPVRGDTTRLQQVVWNLLNNAIKFTPGGGRVGVALR